MAKFKDGTPFNDETGYILISEIIKSCIAEHNEDYEIMQKCQMALQILNMLKEGE